MMSRSSTAQELQLAALSDAKSLGAVLKACEMLASRSY